jgi:hypothetical protein
MKHATPLLLAAVLLATFAPAQKKTVPPFTGTWTLDLHRTTFVGKPHPPIAAEVIIRYDGTHWHRWRSHTAPDGKVDTSAMDLIVDSPKPLVVKNGPVTFYSRITRDGDALVLKQDLVADTGEKATNTVRYTLEDSGKTLVEFEQEVTTQGNETNRWVSVRKK